MNRYEEEKQQVATEIAKFPATFGLRAFPGDVFRVSPTSSYVNGKVILYTEIKKGDKWMSFAKGTVAELRREVVAPEPEMPAPAHTFNLLEFRERYPYKPCDRVLYEGGEREAVSYPWPDSDGARINIRVPDDPTTMHEVDCIELAPLFTDAEKRVIRRAVERAFLDWCINQQLGRGDAFATEKEIRNIATDPLGFASMLDGENAYEFLRRLTRLFV